MDEILGSPKVHVTANFGWLTRLSLRKPTLSWKKIMYSMLNISAEMINRNIARTKFTKVKLTFMNKF